MLLVAAVIITFLPNQPSPTPYNPDLWPGNLTTRPQINHTTSPVNHTNPPLNPPLNFTNPPANFTVCPSSLQRCGGGCIPTNAICCDGAVNSYCLQPTAGCGSGNCPSCPAGKVFCGMFCQPKGAPCCLGGCPDNGTQPSENVVPSIKIESAKATFKEVLDPNMVDCTVELSGTVTAPECANVWGAWGDFGQPAQSFGTIECPEWPACTRYSHFEYKYQGYAYLPVTTTWSVTAEYPFIRGEGSEFFAVLDTPQTPLNWKNNCAEAGLGNRTWDSVVLTCG